MTQTVTTQGGSWAEDDQFNMALSEDVLLGGYVVIPKGTLAFGHVRWATGRGVFGKSGKIEVEVDYLLLGDRQVKLAGVFREDGRGTLTSIGSVAAAGPLAGFITGESGKIAQGTVLTAQLAENIRVIIPGTTPTPSTAGPVMSTVRARQISVSEAFKDTSGPASVPPKQDVETHRITVAEAFEDELNALVDDH
ncbi:hypothetical protein [Porphyrobacter sp. AAP60]|uniref:hypothetical protein n=1 Tax=Porphyrobacter sp. AAP60 TaxID=1523423 RepID=UPI0012E30884|nr:hypothetical protein [Porphyrobacter sp. AAP60]